VAKVFISYKHESADAALADRLASDLSEAGHEVFIDKDIPAAVEFDEYIRGRLLACDAFVVLISRAAHNSRWVRAELEVADELSQKNERRPRIIPLLLEDFSGEWRMDWRVVFKDIQHVRCTDPEKDWPAALAKIRDALRALAPVEDTLALPRMRTLVEGAYPTPISRAFWTAMTTEADPVPALRDLAGVVVRYLALVSLCDLVSRPRDVGSGSGSALRSLDQPLTDARCMEILRLCSAEAPAGPSTPQPLDPDAVPSLLGAALGGRLEELASLTEGVSRPDGRRALPKLRQALAGVLYELTWLRYHRLLAPQALDSQERGTRRYRATLYRGHVLPPPPVTVMTEAALETGRVYLSRFGQTDLLPLHPFLVEEPCAACGGAPDLYFLSYREGRRLHSVSPLTGHALQGATAETAGDTLAALLAAGGPRTGRLWARRLDVSDDPRVARRLAPGEVVGSRNRYHIASFIASGGMADVYEARDDSGRPVALKMLPVELARSEEALRRFAAEVSQARKVEHPNVVRYVDHGEDRGDQYLVLELANGWPLDRGTGRVRDAADLLRRSGTPALAEPLVRSIALEVADGLQAIHEKGIVHRDLKPGNILLVEEDDAARPRRVKVADFGVSREHGAETMTVTGFAVGTPEYMAPEQVRGRGPGGAARPESDIYSLGVVLYELASGSLPRHGAGPVPSGKAGPLEWLSRRAPAVSRGLAGIVMKCLRDDPDARYRSAGDLRRDVLRLERDPRADPVRESESVGPGFRLGGFVLGPELSRDAEAAVHEAIDEATGEPVQLGVLGPALEADESARTTALARLAAVQKIRDPALLPVRCTGEDRGYVYFVTDRPAGPALEGPGLPHERVVRLGLGLARALLALEDAGITHGCVAPERVSLADDPFEPAGRAQLGRVALTSSGGSDAIGLGQVLLRLAADASRARALGGELGPLVEAAIAGRYAGVRALGQALAAIQVRPAPAAASQRDGAFREEAVLGRMIANPLALKVLAGSPAGRALAAGGADGAVWLWDVETRSKVKTLISALRAHFGAEALVTCLAFSPRGDLLASGYHSGAIRLWDLHALSEREVFALASACVGSVTDLAFSPDGLLLASVGADKALRLWETKALCEQPSSKAVDLLAATRPLGTVANALAYVRSGSWIALACADRTLRVRDGLTGAVVIEGEAKGRAEIAEAPQASTNMAASPDGSLLAVAGQDKTIRVFSVEPLAEMRRLAGHAKAVTGVCFFPDGRRIASVARENRVILWDVDKGTASATLWGGGDEVFVGVAVLDGGRRVAAGLSDTRVRVWATEAG
jgi:hypothetical protein